MVQVTVLFTPITTVMVEGLNVKFLIVTLTVVAAWAIGVRAAKLATNRKLRRQEMATTLVGRSRNPASFRSGFNKPFIGASLRGGPP